MRARRLVARLVFPLVATAFACSTSPDAPPGQGTPTSRASLPVRCDTRADAADVAQPADAKVRFTRYAIDRAASGAAFVTAADVNGDKRPDLIVSKFHHYAMSNGAYAFEPGEVTAYLQGDAIDCWEKRDIVTAKDGIYFPNHSTVADVDGDGDADVIVTAGFFACAFDPKVKACGALAWLEQDGGAWKRHDVVPPGSTSFYHHAELVDFDGDGLLDLVTAAESNPKARWFKGDRTPARFASTPLEIGEGLGSFPTVLDLDHDGDLDVASAEFFMEKSSFAWFERTGAPGPSQPAGTWARHVIDDASGRAIQLSFIPGFYGDGVLRAVGTNHVNNDPSGADVIDPGVFVFDPPASPKEKWTRRVIASGMITPKNEGADVNLTPGVFGWGDVDGDGDIDLALSGDGDARTFWVEQTAPGTFATHVLEPKLGQASGGLVVDLDGDGRSELVFTGYEDDAVNVYVRKR